MNNSEKTDQIADALAKAQSNLKAVAKNAEVTVRTNTGSAYTFRYATLDAVIEHVREALTTNGLWFTQTTSWHNDAHIALIHIVLIHTTLWHSSGQWISSVLPVQDGDGEQKLGSRLTYRKRYALCSLLGVAADSDDDANTAEGNDVTNRTEQAHTPLPAPKTSTTPAPKSNITPQDSKARALKFAEDALKFLHAVQSLEELDAWHTQKADSIVRLRSYSVEKHQEVLNVLNAARINLGG